MQAQRSHYFSFSLPHSGFSWVSPKIVVIYALGGIAELMPSSDFSTSSLIIELMPFLPSQQMSKCNFSIRKVELVLAGYIQRAKKIISIFLSIVRDGALNSYFTFFRLFYWLTSVFWALKARLCFFSLFQVLIKPQRTNNIVKYCRQNSFDLQPALL